MPHRIKSLSFLIALVLMASPVVAQSRLANHRQEVAAVPALSGTFGEHIVNVGDFDADGFEDYAVSARNFVTPAGAVGRVFLFSGRNGSLIQSFDGLQSAARFGESIQDVGDVDGDGVRDLCVGAPDFDDPVSGPNAGRVACFSGATAAEIWAIVGEIGSGGNLGVSLGAISDGTLAGTSAVVAGEPNYANTFTETGRVVYYDAATGVMLDTEDGVIAFDGLGKTLATRAGSPTLYAGSVGGRVWLLNGPNSTASPTLLNGSSPGSTDAPAMAIIMGPSAATSGLVIGRKFNDSNGLQNNGDVSFFPNGSNVASLVLQGTTTGESYGARVVAVRDQDGDGIEEIGFASMPTSGFNNSRFQVYTLSGAQVDDIETIGGADADYASLHDVTGDGRGEVLEGIAAGNTGTFAALLIAQGLDVIGPTVLGNGTIQTQFDIDLGSPVAGGIYLQLYGATGRYPGFTYSSGDPVVPINPDLTTQFALSLAGTFFLPDAAGVLDGNGGAQTNFLVDAANAPFVSGVVLSTAVIVFDFATQSIVATTNPVEFTLP
ncbi:MAG TPA: hypothetical protein ENK43_10505 [Planctomycetes bacterium]|nr:hypothetical protein [Planctomycetota bacterium]